LTRLDIWYDPANPEGFSFEQDPDLEDHHIRWTFDDILVIVAILGSLTLFYGGALSAFVYPWLATSGGALARENDSRV
jgi:hypothetical protein